MHVLFRNRIEQWIRILNHLCQTFMGIGLLLECYPFCPRLALCICLSFFIPVLYSPSVSLTDLDLSLSLSVALYLFLFFSFYFALTLIAYSWVIVFNYGLYSVVDKSESDICKGRDPVQALIMLNLHFLSLSLSLSRARPGMVKNYT